MTRRGLALLGALLAAGCAPAGDTGAVCRAVAGWTVHVSRTLLAQEPQAAERALALLEQQLQEVARDVPAAAVARLRQVPLYVSPEYPGFPPRAEFHPGAEWLRKNGRDPAMAKGVEFTNVRIFEQEADRMPNFALHELAHAYHDLAVPQGYANPQVKAAYEKAKASGAYGRVERWHGSGRTNTFDRAYALTNPMEYFAENSEAFFSRNDFFPFTRDQLKRHDPEMFALLEKLWGASARTPTKAPQAVRTLAELDAALRAAGPGDTVHLTDGVYSTKQPIKIEGLSGAADRPVIIRAEHRGCAVIDGVAGFALTNCEHVVLEGFAFAHDADAQAVLLNGCRCVRITRSDFRLRERKKPRHMEHWVYAVGASSASNRIDHNRFERKVNSGSYVFVRGDDVALVCSQHDRIDHNHFRNVIYANDENGHETVRAGSNDLGASGRSSFAVIEDNLFENCSGEHEVMSLKSSDNVVRRNTLVNCFGAICLRLGNRDEVCGNVIIATDNQPGRGGVMAYGYDHRIYSNFFQGLTGTKHEAPLSLIPGTFETPATDRIGKAYDSLTTVPATRAWIACNTWIDCAPLQFGFKPHEVRKYIPRACTFESNLVVRTQPQKAPLIHLEQMAGVQASGNIGYDAGRALEGAWAGWFGTEEHRASHVPHRPLTAADVGPDAP